MLTFNLDTVTSDQVKQLIANGDDSHRNQIRCNHMRQLYLSQDIVGAQDIEALLFRFETFEAGNDYIGRVASENPNWIKRLYDAITNWRDTDSHKTYIDVF